MSETKVNEAKRTQINCPLCGGDNVWIHRDDGRGDESLTEGYWLHCRSCGAQGKYSATHTFAVKSFQNLQSAPQPAPDAAATRRQEFIEQAALCVWTKVWGDAQVRDEDIIESATKLADAIPWLSQSPAPAPAESVDERLLVADELAHRARLVCNYWNKPALRTGIEELEVAVGKYEATHAH
jgi:hypothetical protein